MSEELTWMSAWKIRDLIAAKDVSPVEVTEHFLGRIEEFDKSLNAFATLDAKGAREQAKRAEQAVSRGDELGRLHGIPISLKEHIPVVGLPTQELFGTNVSVATRDEVGVERLRRAGAIVFGTNTQMGTSGGAVRRDDDPTVYKFFNWEAEARNPWDPTRVPGWSSAGPAAAAAARLVPVAIGSDGGGSTRLPGAYCGIVGVHPTAGLIPSVDYTGPQTLSSLTIGPLCRDVIDAAITLQVMAGPDGRDFLCQQFDPPDYLEQIGAGVAGMRFAWTDNFAFTERYAQSESLQVIAAVREAASAITSLGASFETTDVVLEDFFRARSEVVEPEEWTASVETRGRNWQRMRDLLAEYDLLLSATSQILPKKVEEWDAAWTTDGAKYPHGRFASVYTSHTRMFNWLAFPAVSVPCGFVDGLPIGLQIIGLPYREDRILRAANAFQQAFPRPEQPFIS